MKTILIPTDYSETAGNALQYAIELAKFSSAKIILMHAYQVPVPTGEVPIMMISPKELKEENQKRIKLLEKKVKEQTEGKIKTETVVREGFTIDEITNVIKKKRVDLVVMGIKGAGKVSQTLIGSHTSSLIKKTQAPVLVIPADAKFKEIKKIALAHNYSEIANEKALNKFKKFAKMFNAKVLVVDVEKPSVVPTYENEVSGETLEKSLKDTEHVMFFSSAKNIEDGLNEFAEDHNCDWLAMIPHTHNIFDRVLHKSNTKKMVFHTHIPLLSIHD